MPGANEMPPERGDADAGPSNVTPYPGYAEAHCLEGHTRAVAAVKYSPDGNVLASACEQSMAPK